MKRFLDTWREWWSGSVISKKISSHGIDKDQNLDPVKHPLPLSSRRLLTNSSITTAIVAALGLLLIGFFPDSRSNQPVVSNVPVTTSQDSRGRESGDQWSWSTDISTYAANLENGLAALLNQISGTGNVQVFLTLSQGPRREFVEDRTENRQVTEEVDRQGGNRTITSVQTTNSVVKVRYPDGNEGLVTRVEYSPIIQGVLVVADNGDDPTVKLEITKAVSTVLGIAEYRVRVLPRG